MIDLSSKTALLRRWLGPLAFGVMLLLLASALLKAASPVPRPPTLVVCWGNDGGIPAVALEAANPAAPNEPFVLLPGSTADARCLRNELQSCGVSRLGALFMPTGAPFPRGAEVLATAFQTREFLAGMDSRSRLDWQPLRQRLAAQGTAIREINPSEGRCWTVMLGDWRLTYRKLPNGAFRGELTSAAGPDLGPAAAFALRVTGEFLVGPLDETQPVWAALPKTNRAGCQRFPLRTK